MQYNYNENRILYVCRKWAKITSLLIFKRTSLNLKNNILMSCLRCVYRSLVKLTPSSPMNLMIWVHCGIRLMLKAILMMLPSTIHQLFHYWLLAQPALENFTNLKATSRFCWPMLVTVDSYSLLEIQLRTLMTYLPTIAEAPNFRIRSHSFLTSLWLICKWLSNRNWCTLILITFICFLKFANSCYFGLSVCIYT